MYYRCWQSVSEPKNEIFGASQEHPSLSTSFINVLATGDPFEFLDERSWTFSTCVVLTQNWRVTDGRKEGHTYCIYDSEFAWLYMFPRYKNTRAVYYRN